MQQNITWRLGNMDVEKNPKIKTKKISNSFEINFHECTEL